MAIPNYVLLSDIEQVELESLLPADSPRVAGEDAAHILALAELDAELPPLVVHRPSMRVIDGMHRLRAARLRGDEKIAARFYDGDEQDAFVLAVRLNAAHGLPLTQSDRSAAAARIIRSHPQWSDRLIASASGLSHRTVAAIRRRSTGDVVHSNTRRGRDGRVRPLNAAEGRRLAFRLMTERPGASLREIAEEAGIAVSTARDVRQRVGHGQDPVPPKLRGELGERADFYCGAAVTSMPAEEIRELIDRLRRDPSLRFTDTGRTVLRLMGTMQTVSADEWTRLVHGVPPHTTEMLAQVARTCAETWLYFAREVETRGYQPA
ncbi:ParB N-terminal domain-containing protein [Nonomuraea longicatena]|uniref:ParB N-terminal domain-containing protein n=1 Tax=Nonomuraea longicatena TaxID=83682 RepID=A0ABP4AKI3_9ACTN